MKLFRQMDSETANYYQDKRNTDLDGQVPTWDISLSNLKRFYDQARFDTYLHPKRTMCPTSNIKRRIPWLYAKDGLYFVLQ